MKREEIEELRRLVASGDMPAEWSAATDRLVIDALPRLLAERDGLLSALKLALSESHGIACEANTEWEDVARTALALAES